MVDVSEGIIERQINYLILRELFANSPTPKYLEGLQKESILEDLSEGNEGRIYGYKRRLIKLLEERGENYESYGCDTEKEYYQLFLNPIKNRAPLWESYYLHPEGLLFQESTYDARKCYLKYSFLSNSFPKEPDDHLVTELDFMLKLSSLSIEDGYKEREVIQDQISFLEDHLLQWVPQLSEKICSYKEGRWYLALAEYLEAFLIEDLKVLHKMLSEID